MKKKGKNKKVKVFIFILIVIGVIAGISIVLMGMMKPVEKEKPVKVNTVSIDGYGIHLDDLDTDLYREEYNVLKKNLLSEQIDNEEYAKSVAKLFIIDLYTIKNKVNKYDIGGVDFVYDKALANYKTNVTDTLYKYVEDNSKNDRTQNLPVVNSINVEKCSSTTFKIENDDKYSAYKIKLNWTYSIDLGYDKEAEVIVINKDNKMYVVEKN